MCYLLPEIARFDLPSGHMSSPLPVYASSLCRGAAPLRGVGGMLPCVLPWEPRAAKP